jgi:hypothetical protein
MASTLGRFGSSISETWIGAVQAVAASDQVAQGSEVTVLGTVRHAVLVEQLGVTEGDVRRFDG